MAIRKENLQCGVGNERVRGAWSRGKDKRTPKHLHVFHATGQPPIAISVKFVIVRNIKAQSETLIE